MWRKLLSFSGHVFAGIVVIAAITMSFIRGYPSLYQHYLPMVQDHISSIIGKPVRVETIRVDWHGYTPFIAVDDLLIYADASKQNRLLFAKKALLSVDVYNSLMQKKFHFHQLTLIGSNLEAMRTIDRRIVLNGIDVSEKISKRTQLDSDNGIRLSLLDSAIAIKDEVKNLNYFFDGASVVLDLGKDRFKIAANFLLPEMLGDSMVFVADLKDFGHGLNEVTGSFYTKGQNIKLEWLSNFFPKLQTAIHSGESDFEIWADLRPSSERSFNGKLKLRDLKYSNKKKSLPNVMVGKEITALETQFQIKSMEDNWRLALLNSTIRATGQEWPGRKYEMSCMDCSKPAFLITAALDYVDVTQLLATLQHFPIISARLQPLLIKTQVGGVFEDSSILARWHGTQLAQYMYRTSLQGATLLIPDRGLEILSLTGEMRGNHVQGSLTIEDSDMHIHASKIVDRTFRDQKAIGVVKWKHVNNGVIAALENTTLLANELNVNLQGSVHMNHGEAYADIQGQVSYAQITSIKKLLPYENMPPKLAKWLMNSVNGGALKTARLLFRGNPEHFPFEDHLGVFQVLASVEDGVLDYRTDWPGVHGINTDLEIRNRYLIINGYQGKILNSSINHVTATIEDVKLPRLVINGNARGPAGDVLDFLQQSALIPKNSQIPRHISVDGDIGLDLNLVFTLTGKLEKERIVNGIIEFQDTDLTVPSLSLPFKNLKGKLKLNRHGVEGQDLSADLYGLNFNADARSVENGRTLLTVTGNFNLDSHLTLTPHYEQVNKYIQGVAPVLVTINLPGFGRPGNDKSLEIGIDSDLTGTLITLPEPLRKESDDYKPLSISTRYQAGERHPLFVSFNNEAFMQVAFNQDVKGIPALELRMGDDQFDLPSQGLKISGIFDQLNVAAWQSVLQSLDQKSVIELSEIDIQAGNISAFDLDFENVDFQLQKNAQHWAGKIDSSIAKGKFDYPLNPDLTDIATGTFDYLKFGRPEKRITYTVDPRKLPALEIRARQFEFNGYAFDDMVLRTKPSSAGMVIDSLAGKGNDLQVTVTGVWEVGANEVHNTSLDIILATQNLHNSFTGLGFETSISKGQGGVTAKFNWPNTPYQFSVDSFLGSASIRFEDGEILSVDPGAGRLIGLFNIAEISRRLSLDFSDFFSKGYVFDKIRGDLVFKDANLTTDNLSIQGPSADILIEGRTGIAAKDYDQTVTVTPNVSGGLPWVGLIVGGPVGAIGTIVGGKIAETIGIDVDKVTEVKYAVTGSWDDPKVEPIKRTIAKVTPSIEGQHSP